MLALIMFLNVIFVVCNALCDAWVNRKSDVSWMRWHIPKWIHFYGTQALIIFLLIKLHIIPIHFVAVWIGVVYAIVCGVLWRWFYSSFR